MTIQYSGNLFSVCFRWHGSLWKTIWKEMAFFLVLYFSVNGAYRLMPKKDQHKFEAVVKLVGEWVDKIPLQFFLGFYVSYILGRWWDQVTKIPRPDPVLLTFTTYLSGTEETDKVIRQTFARWLNLNCVLVWRKFSIKIKKRFPEDLHLLGAGLMTLKEYSIYKSMDPEFDRAFLPVMWCYRLIGRCLKDGKITSDASQQILSRLDEFKSGNRMLFLYNWVSPPLIYTQLAALATYGYFVLGLIGRQAVVRDIDGNVVDPYVPVVTVVEFLFYIGWLKIAEFAREPFGEEDDDIDINYLLDRNVYMSNVIINLSDDVPLETTFLLSSPSSKVAHTKGSIMVEDRRPKNRLANLHIPEEFKEQIMEKRPQGFFPKMIYNLKSSFYEYYPLRSSRPSSPSLVGRGSSEGRVSAEGEGQRESTSARRDSLSREVSAAFK